MALLAPDMYLENFLGIKMLMADAGADFAVIAPLLTTFGYGWGAGKFAAICAGPAGVKKFSQVNVIPMLGMIYISYDYDDMMGLGTWGAFLVCYLYFGFIEKSKKK